MYSFGKFASSQKKRELPSMLSTPQLNARLRVCFLLVLADFFFLWEESNMAAIQYVADCHRPASCVDCPQKNQFTKSVDLVVSPPVPLRSRSIASFRFSPLSHLKDQPLLSLISLIDSRFKIQANRQVTMAFQSTSRGIYISGSILQAECRDWNKDWRSASLDLDKFIGNSDGQFSLSDKDFSRSADNLQLCGSKLSASLRRRDGQQVKATLDLNLCVANMNGSLEFQKPFVHPQEGLYKPTKMANCITCPL